MSAVAEERLLAGWGRTAPTRAEVVEVRAEEQVAGLLAGAGERGALARGLGRAYGDAAQNAGGLVLALEGLDGVRAFDAESGRITVGAGMSIDGLLDHVLPSGWFVPVAPGTAHVTVGGAIAADVHGKNHHADGSWIGHVRSFVLITPAGERLECEPGEDAFRATAGGMGLTGVVTEATLDLIEVETAHCSVDTERADDLDDALARMEAGDAGYRYSVAWVDCLAAGRHLGRSVLLRGDHATRAEVQAAEPLSRRRPPRLPAPPWAPRGLLNRASLAAFNAARYHRAPRCERARVEPLDAFFFPLDAVQGWNRLYGRDGFLQYQFVVPFGAEDVLHSALERLGGGAAAPLLAVLKRFGPASEGLLSFPAPGWTLALDIPARASGLGGLLDQLDELVAGAGGRVYLAKDSRLRPDLLAAMYPQLDAWREVRARLDPRATMRSDLARRTGLAG